jgi:hypothetical protein
MRAATSFVALGTAGMAHTTDFDRSATAATVGFAFGFDVAIFFCSSRS